MQAAGDWTFDVVGGGARQREEAIRLAVNLAMYLLCSDYKDDQVHAAWLMRHRLQIRK
jgi:ribosomal protein S9